MKFAFVDIETSGSHMRHDRIIEIGILRVENDKLTRTYNKLINPEVPVSPFIQDLTGIRIDELEYAPTFEQVKEEILEMLDGVTFVAHNVRFDYGFLKNEFRRFGMPFTTKQLCTVKLSRALFPQYRRHNLDSIIDRFDLQIANRHRAFDDAQILWKFYEYLVNKFSEKQIEKTVEKVMFRPSLPATISEKHIEAIPESPGVYIFYGPKKLPLYIGKSINIRDRVLSHFASDQESAKEFNIKQQIQEIETIVKAGELGALLTEAELIKKMRPLYNRRLRTVKTIHIVSKSTDKKGFFVPVIDRVTHIDANTVDKILGIFPSKKNAKEYLKRKAEEHGLCQKILGLEKTSGACFAYKLEQCRGACIGRENHLSHNIRFIEALSEHKIKHWPFSGPIIITEYDPIEGRKEEYIVDKWCLISDKNAELVFDYDAYKILARYIFKQRNQFTIHKLDQVDDLHAGASYPFIY